VSTPVDSLKRHISDVHFFSPDTGWFFGEGQDGIYTRMMFGYTMDGGVTWDTTVFAFGSQYNVDFWGKLLSIRFNGVILRTDDGWKTWTKPFVDTIGLAGAGEFASATHVYAGGLNTIIKSTDSGLTWNYIQPPGMNFERISDVSTIDSNIVYMISGSKLLKSIDGGINWIEIALPPDHYVRYWGVEFITEKYGWITGEYRTVFLTTDGGGSWINQCPPVDYDAFKKIDALDEYTAIIGSSAGAIFRTNDGGNTWIEQVPKEIYPIIRNLQIVTYDVAYAVGDYGTMLKTTTGGVTWIKDGQKSSISKYNLDQNYPSSFNSTTKIRWQTPVSSWQSLKVYDILGNNVTTLVDENRPAGNYEIEFNARNLSSGVYFYQLRAGNFIDTKKMVLLK
jgi:photosystem II stability/assembly factor-like uncharacterized protein